MNSLVSSYSLENADHHFSRENNKSIQNPYTHEFSSVLQGSVVDNSSIIFNQSRVSDRSNHSVKSNKSHKSNKSDLSSNHNR